MNYKVAIIEVKIRLDPVPGWGHEPEDYVGMLQHHLDGVIPHYKPTVTLKGIEDENLLEVKNEYL